MTISGKLNMLSGEWVLESGNYWRISGEFSQLNIYSLGIGYYILLIGAACLVSNNLFVRINNDKMYVCI